MSTVSQFQDYKYSNDNQSSLLSEDESQFALPCEVNKNSLACHKIKSEKLKRNKKRFNQSTWTLKQNSAYKNFLQEYQDLFQADNRSRRSMRINVLISRFIKTRSSDQCRSHHQKMIKCYKNVPAIIKHIETLQVNLDFQKTVKTSAAIAEEELTPDTQNNEEVGGETLLLIKSENIWQLVEDHVWWDGSEF